MNLLLESMTPLKVCGYNVRVWRQETMPNADPGGCFVVFDKSALLKVERKINDVGVSDPLVIAKLILDADPRVNAVEVLDPEKHGVVLYKDWP